MTGEGGHMLHHLAQRLPEPRDTILLVGFQAEGTRARSPASGANTVEIHGRYIGVRAEARTLDGFSAHADRAEILTWLRAIGRELGWTAVVPRLFERISLG